MCLVFPTHWSAMMGGAQYQVKQLTEHLIDSGHAEVYCLVKRFAVGENNEGYFLVNIGSGLHARLARGTLLDTWPLWRALMTLKPDVVYQRVGGAYTGTVGLYARYAGCRFVWHVAHDYDVTAGKFAGDAGPLAKGVEKYLLEVGARRADVVITQTRQQARLLCEHYGREDAEVIPNAHPVPSGPFQKSMPVKILWVANLKRWKRPEVFIELARRMIDLRDVEFLMVGKPSPDLAWQAGLDNEINGTPNLTYLGECSQEQVNEMMASAHIFVNTSESEGFPNTFIQAWMRNVPVVSLGFDPDGILGRGRIGCSARDVPELCDLVRILALDSATRARMGQLGRECALRHHSPRNFDKLVNLLLRDL